MISMSLGDPIVYWLLRILLLVALLVCGWGISYQEKKFFKVYALVAGAAYSLIQGLRWNRGQDYPHYYSDLMGKWETPDPELLYDGIVNFLSNILCVPYWVSFVIYSALLISAFLLVLKKVPKIAVWALPLFFIMTGSAENLIRQYLAVSFVIYAYNAYLSNNFKLVIIYLVCVPFIHASGLFAVFFFILFAIIKFEKIIKNPWILLGIYVLLYFFWDNSYFSFLTDFLQNLNFGDDYKMRSYLDNSERWFSEEGSLSFVLGTKSTVSSLISDTVSFLSYILVIYYGFYACKINSQIRIAYGFTYLAIIMKIIGGDIEMYARFYNWLIYLSPIVIGTICMTPMKLKERWVVWAILIINFYFYGFIRQIGNIPYAGCAFIWDR